MRTHDVAEPQPAPAIVHRVLVTPGRPLDRPARRMAARRLGHDFGEVRVHADAPAAASARALGADAFAVGRHVVFGAGRYAPHGDGLLLHELAHVVQQRGRARAPGSAIAVRPPDEPHEHAAAAIGRGGSPAILTPGSVPVAVQRQTPLPGQAAPEYKICSRPLQGQLADFGNHAYIEAPSHKYAVIGPFCPASWSDNFFTGTTAQKWDNSPDPCGNTPTCVTCRPTPEDHDVGRCLREAYAAYASPSLYVGLGPNSNTFVGTLARKCCGGMTDKPSELGNCPGWYDDPAPARAGAEPCPPGPACR